MHEVHYCSDDAFVRSADCYVSLVLIPASALSIRFKEHLNSHEPKELLFPEEYEELRALCRQSQKAERAEQAQESEQERPPGEEEPTTPEGTDSVSDALLPHTQL